MVVDAESWGLHGPILAVGMVIGDLVERCSRDDIKRLEVAFVERESSWFWCSDEPLGKRAAVSRDDLEWARRYVIPGLQEASRGQQDLVVCGRTTVIQRFKLAWLKEAAKGTELWAECGWPVEARLLMEAQFSRLDGPLPLHEIASVRKAAGFNPVFVQPRQPAEKPEHHPVCDARQSARLLAEALTRLGQRGDGPW
jgi:hypothetical protein